LGGEGVESKFSPGLAVRIGAGQREDGKEGKERGEEKDSKPAQD